MTIKLQEKLLILHSGVVLSHLANAKESEKRFRKRSGLPYSVHVSEVMKRVSQYGINFEQSEDAQYAFEVLAAACAHDIVEDTDLDLKDFEKAWGKSLLNLIQECSRSEEDSRTKQGKWNFLCSFGDKSWESLIIKIADRYCNTMDYFENDPEYAAYYALQAFPLYIYFARIFRPLEVAKKVDKDICSLFYEIVRPRYGTEVSLRDTEEMFEKVHSLVV